MMTSARRRMSRIGLLAAACLFPGALSAEEFGDAAKGYAFALKHCAGCHAVKPGEDYSPHPGARSFTSAATESAMTGRALAVWLDTSHPTMPNFILHADDRNNVIAYILSLKPPKPK
jgi:mono/diheme cytochrome c family protein